MRKQIIIGNWKMNGSLLSIKSLCESLNKLSTESLSADMAVCVPNVYLSYVSDNIKGVALGVQNVSQYDDGAYTGEISVSMLKDFNCQYAIVGHSERRALFGESNIDVALKAKKATEAGLCAIVCVGETLEERTSGKLEEVLKTQLSTVLNELTLNQLRNVIIAYEPVWAIGTGLAATASQVQEVHAYLRSIVTNFHVELAKNIKIIYGGSLKPSNADEILKLADVDGGLIGGASLCGKDFGEIVKHAKAVKNAKHVK
ncbi:MULTISPECIES: triose-phosphate isomerase [Cysteiniphilum]|uniref:Triosephosphate isomerase n=1 Tax=Cysteiniphilum litorale TaxID=2056700 RepID=A0A8J3E936_9GAMM|nr:MULTISPECIES: triose-phosphate isomerase [Cysteiniphilum]GGF96199.1 triosephosphate isomerase [Cysteiniphilum litorale]